MRARRVAAAFAALLLVMSGATARAAPAYALPASVRINIALAGTSYAVVSSTGALVVRAPDGSELYRSLGRVAVRTDVRRLEDDTPLPPAFASASGEERRNRAILLREARLAAHLSSRTLVRIPFELDALRDLDDALGSPVFQANAVTALQLEPADGGVLFFNGRGYRGTFEIAPGENGFIVINTVPTERYLVSVVGSEVPTDWHRQALAAQAIAARTYLLKHLGKRGSYDLEGDERDQAYKGVGGEAASTERAVAETSGVVATYHGVPIDAFYSANAGGATEDSENVWLTPLPYLRSVPSPYDATALQSSWGASSYQWVKEYTEPALRRQLERGGLAVGAIQAIDIVEKTATGGVVRARVQGSRGTQDVLKDSTRWYFGLKSQLFTVAFHPSDEQELVDAANRTRLSELDGLGADRTGLLIGADAVASDGGVVLTNFRTTRYLFRLPARIVFTGKGYGHRVGMSQWGMQGMALAGANYEEILTHYYRGVELTTIAGP